MHRGRPGADHHLRKAARDLLPEPAVRLLLPRADQPTPAGKSRAGGSHHRAQQDRATDAPPLTAGQVRPIDRRARHDASSKHHPALFLCLSMISAQMPLAFVARESRYTLFRIMLLATPPPRF